MAITEENISVKFSVYTLVCNELLKQLSSLRVAALNDDRLPHEMCIQRFDDALSGFLKRSSESDVVEATRLFGNRLRTESADIRRINKQVSQIFENIADAAVEKSSEWNYLNNIEEFHVQGRKYAQLFFDKSPFQVTKDRLQTSCQFEIEYEVPVDDQDAACIKPFGGRKSIMAYYPKYEDEISEVSYNNLIMARFTLDHGFSHYLSYPFLFLHEYTAHVFALDYKNARFNDGWMLIAASSYLKQNWTRGNELFNELARDQASVFEEYLYAHLTPIPRNACGFVRSFATHLGPDLADKFMQITYELAAFHPEAGENEFWPEKFVIAIENEFSANNQIRSRLIQKIRTAASNRELMSILSPV